VSDFHNQYVDGFEAGQLALEGIIESLTAERYELRKEVQHLKETMAQSCCSRLEANQRIAAAQQEAADIYNPVLEALQAKLAAVREAGETLLFAMDQWRKGAYRVEGCQLAERNLKAAIAATVKE
jgi:Pyruvate/2-oxoacid:ferredoxin oxidoreductase gamma subunit